MLAVSLRGLELFDQGLVFALALPMHIAAGLTCVVSGALAATAHKGPGRHRRAGLVYYTGLCLVFATATVLAVLRWAHLWHLFVLASLAFAAGTVGYLVRRNRRNGWERWHIVGMGASYIVLLTGFYVDNGPQLPIWDRLPNWAFWVLPSVIGLPIMARTLRLGPGGRISAARPGRGRTDPTR